MKSLAKDLDVVDAFCGAGRISTVFRQDPKSAPAPIRYILLVIN